MPVRPLLAVLAVLLACVVPAAPALAASRDATGWSDPGSYGGGGWDGGPGSWDGGGGWDGTGSDPGAGAWPGDGSPPTDPGTPVPTEPGLPMPTPEPPVLPTIPPTRTVAGRVAKLRTDGKAAIPRSAPKRVQALISAANRIVGKPYKWGGGHARLADSGYDCSGAVSYALIGAGLLTSPEVSGALAHWDAGGAGRWVTVYANKGHVYLEVAGLRLDTSPVGDFTRRSGVRWRPVIGRRPGFAVRHAAGL